MPERPEDLAAMGGQPVDDPHELSTEEVAERFLEYLKALVDYWDSQDVPSRRRLEGLVHSILVALAGNALPLPAFLVAPYPHPEDRQFFRDRGSNWYPENNADGMQAQIAGALRERWARACTKGRST